MAELSLPQFPEGEIVVEIATERNRRHFFGPAGEQPLRGRWSGAGHMGRSGEAFGLLMGIDFIPGIRIGIDVEKRTVRTFDPLGTPEFAGTLEALKKAAKAQPQMFHGKEIEPWKEVVHTCEDRTPQETANLLKDWLYWTRRIVDGKHGKVIAGTLPDLRDIRERFPGSRRRTHLSEIAQDEKDIWTDHVPIDGKGKGNGNGGGRGGNGGNGGGPNGQNGQSTDASKNPQGAAA